MAPNQRGYTHGAHPGGDATKTTRPRQSSPALSRRALGRGLIAALGAASAPAARATVDLDTAPGGATHIAPAPVYAPATSLRAVADIYSRMTVSVRVNDQGPFPFVVDTGANQSVIGETLAATLGLTIGPMQPLHGVAGVRPAPSTIASVQVGALARRMMTLSILPEASLGGAGMLGVNGLEGKTLTLDFEGQTMAVDDGRRSRRDPDAISVKALRRSGQLTLIDADLDGVALVTFLDSGANNSIGNLALRSLAATRSPTTIWTRTPIVSATGQMIEAEWAQLPHLRVAGLSLPYWPVAFADLHVFELWGLDRRPALLLGVDVLSRFRYVSLDFLRDEVRFRLPT